MPFQPHSKEQERKKKNRETPPKKAKNPKSTPGNTADKKLKVKIIDKFIKNNPNIKKLKPAEVKSKSDLAEDSVHWNHELASEYLAEIYLNQGNKKRATEIYEALKLKFPEKETYFADLISNIE